MTRHCGGVQELGDVMALLEAEVCSAVSCSSPDCELTAKTGRLDRHPLSRPNHPFRQQAAFYRFAITCKLRCKRR